MPLDNYRDRTRRRRRRKIFGIIALVVLLIGGLAGLAYQAYVTGKALARRDVTRLEEQLAAQTDTIEELRNGTDQLIAEVANAKVEYEKLRVSYQQDVPAGEEKELYDIMRRRVADGISSARLRFLISTAKEHKECDDAPVTKRFLVRTPLFDGANDVVGFANGQILVTATGASAKSDSGATEAWYDPARPVEVTFRPVNGQISAASGTLPLTHSVVLGDREFRFNVTLGKRGFAVITGITCPYP